MSETKKPPADKSPRSQAYGKPADPETHWHEIVDLRDPDKQKQAMTVLLERYDAVIRWRLAADLRCGGKDLDDAYGDFVLWVMKGNQFMEAEESRGQFRKYLAMKLKSFLIDRIRYRNAGKRGGMGVVHVELEDADDHSCGITHPNEALFDREWARELLRRAMQRMEETELSEGDLLDRAETYGNAAFAKRFRHALREEVSLTCRMGWVDEELKHLAMVLAAIRGDLSLVPK